jgi:hypothetical protein
MNRVFAWPVGREEEGRRTGLSVVLVFALSATVGGLLLGAVIGLVSVLFSGVPRPWLVTPIVLLVFLATLFQIAGRMGPFPERRRQVPTPWLQAPPWITAAGFGILLGSGTFTWLHNAAAYSVIAALLWLGRLDVALICGLIFGATRGLVPLLFRLTVSQERQAVRLQSFFAGKAAVLLSRLVLATTSGILLVLLCSQIGRTA